MDLTKHVAEVDLNGTKMSFTTGHIARQANGAVMAQLGDSVSFVVATMGGPNPWGEPGVALTVDYREKTFAAGKFPGGFIKREGRPTIKETLTCRLIDRPIRPLFPKGFCQQVAVNALIVSFDGVNDTDVLSINGASAALAISDIPCSDIVGAVRVGYVDEKYVINPSVRTTLDESMLDLVVVGSRKGVTMVESGSEEISEEIILGAIKHGFEAIQDIITVIEKLQADCGKTRTWEPDEANSALKALATKLDKSHRKALLEAHSTTEKFERATALKEVKTSITEKYHDETNEDQAYSKQELGDVCGDLLSSIIRGEILEGRRSDGRDLLTIRPIHNEVGLLPRVHGSTLFTRGETQTLVAATLGIGRDAQIIDGLGEEYEMDFYLQYTFPSYCVGETWPNRGPKRREYGHGALAERALRAVMPSNDDFPYTIRICSEIMESNGSSSMASVCGGSLALMDAGVPIEKAVAGIAMGLVKEGDKVAVISDILGSEDHDGDMDFKVAGTADGITALQMDIKIDNLDFDTMEKALAQAKDGRIHILGEMNKSLSATRDEISEHAPRMVHIKINPEKIGAIIGPGGKNIRALQERTCSSVEIQDDGTVTIAGTDAAMVQSAKEEIEAMTAEAVIGQTYDARVTGMKDFGAFCEIIPGQDGLLHISEYSYEYCSDISQFLNMGDIVKVQVLDIDTNGKIRLSRKSLLEKPEGYDEAAEKKKSERKPRPARSGGGGGGGRRR